MYRLDFDNPWIAAVDQARRQWRAWAAVGVSVLILLCLMGGARALAAMALEGHAVLGSVAMVVLFGGLAGSGLLLNAIQGRPPPSVRPSPGQAGAGVLTGVASLAVAMALSAGFGGASVMPAPGMWAGALLAAGLVLLQAGAEELFFRDWLQPLLAARLGPWVGLAVTSLIFSAAHGLGAASGPLAFVNIALAGAVFGLLALRTGNLVAPIGAHWAWNWCEQSLLGVSPNPGFHAQGAIFDIDLVGPALWGGGADGLNGSLGVTLGLGLAAAGLMAAGGLRKPGLADRRSGPVPP